jgi:CheY-like chemotaxis protein
MATILLVEDNPLNQEMLILRLQRRGYTLITANDGAVGVAMAQDFHPDLILMDISLPVMDGYEATRVLKAAPDTAAIPVIALTAHAMPEDEAKCRAAGCDDYDTKPVDFPRLLAKIHQCLHPGTSS